MTLADMYMSFPAIWIVFTAAAVVIGTYNSCVKYGVRETMRELYRAF
jgi:hypothetical protein